MELVVVMLLELCRWLMELGVEMLLALRRYHVVDWWSG